MANRPERTRAEQFSSAGQQGLPGVRLGALHHVPRAPVRVASRPQLSGRRGGRGRVDSECLFVLDFSVLKQITRRLVDEIDHKVLLPALNPKLAYREEGNRIAVDYFGTPTYVFPTSDCAMLEIQNSTAEMLAQYLGTRVRDELAPQRLHPPDPAGARGRGELRAVGDVPSGARRRLTARRGARQRGHIRRVWRRCESRSPPALHHTPRSRIRSRSCRVCTPPPASSRTVPKPAPQLPRPFRGRRAAGSDSPDVQHQDGDTPVSTARAAMSSGSAAKPASWMAGWSIGRPSRRSRLKITREAPTSRTMIGEIDEGVQRLQSHDHFARAAREHLEHAS